MQAENGRKPTASQPIPTFEEYCEWASGNSLITNVEIKSSVYYYEELEKKTMELIERFGLKERIIISSFNHLSALSCKDFMPDMKTGALVENGRYRKCRLLLQKVWV